MTFEGAILVGVVALGLVATMLLVWREVHKPLTAGDLETLDATVRWSRAVRSGLAAAEAELQWISRDVHDDWDSLRPARAAAHARRRFTAEQREADELLTTDLLGLVTEINGRVLKRSLVECHPFFDSIESKPLTPEQAAAVVTMDNRVQVVAAAGSGKTSVMVARAAYAIRYGVVEPETGVAPRVQPARPRTSYSTRIEDRLSSRRRRRQRA